MLRCNVSFITCLLVMVLCIVPLTAFAQIDQTPVDRDIPKIPEDQRELLSPAADHGAEMLNKDLVVETDSLPRISRDTSLDSLKTNLSAEDLVEEPVLAKKEFLFTNLDMQVTAVTFLMWIVMMCWAAFSS